MAHFYIDEELESASVGDRVALGGAEARHAVTVSRLAVGETVSIGNGAGLVVSGQIVTAEHTSLVVGPEGGISPQELDALSAAGAEVVRLGPEVLRTSTAGPAAIAVLNAKLHRW